MSWWRKSYVPLAFGSESESAKSGCCSHHVHNRRLCRGLKPAATLITCPLPPSLLPSLFFFLSFITMFETHVRHSVDIVLHSRVDLGGSVSSPPHIPCKLHCYGRSRHCGVRFSCRTFHYWSSYLARRYVTSSWMIDRY